MGGQACSDILMSYSQTPPRVNLVFSLTPPLTSSHHSLQYYSGGQPFYANVDLMRNEGMTLQEGSYFSLDAPGWRLIHLDTGYHSRDLTHCESNPSITRHISYYVMLQQA